MRPRVDPFVINVCYKKEEIELNPSTLSCRYKDYQKETDKDIVEILNSSKEDASIRHNGRVKRPVPLPQTKLNKKGRYDCLPKRLAFLKVKQDGTAMYHISLSTLIDTVEENLRKIKITKIST